MPPAVAAEQRPLYRFEMGARVRVERGSNLLVGIVRVEIIRVQTQRKAHFAALEGARWLLIVSTLLEPIS